MATYFKKHVCFHYLFFTYLYSPKDSKTFKCLMRCVWRPSSSVAISKRCCNLWQHKMKSQGVAVCRKKGTASFHELTDAKCNIVSHSFSVITPSKTTRLVPFRTSSSIVMVTPTWWIGPPGERTNKTDESGSLSLLTSTGSRVEWWPYLHRIHCHPRPPAALPLSFSHSFSLFQL